MKKSYDVMFVYISDGKRVADTIEVSASTLYEASDKFWNYIEQSKITDVKYIDFTQIRRAV